MTEILGKEKDMAVREFNTSNMVDILQMQIAKMYGYTTGAYAFGNGPHNFPTYMEKKHPGVWCRLKRHIGNRAHIFLENAI